MEQNQFPVEIAERIVRMLHEVTNGNVNFMVEGGVIIASVQPERVGTIHDGAKRIMSGEMDEIAISMEDAEKMQGVRIGYNGSVWFKGDRIGCIGLGGEPEKMRPLQKLSAIIVKEEYEKYLEVKHKKDIIEKVAGEIDEMTVAIEQITAGSEDILNYSKEIEEMADTTEKQIGNINKVLEAIKVIAAQTKLLGLNAAIESARAGEFGKGFAVVSQEIGRLSTHSTESLKDINKILGEVKASIVKIAEMIRKNTVVVSEQSDSMHCISSSIVGIKVETDKLVNEG